jgi:hypothetical protein
MATRVDPDKNNSVDFSIPLRVVQVTEWGPARFQVRIGPQHPLVYRKRRLNGAVLRLRPEKPRSQQVWHDKDPSLLKVPKRRAQAKILKPYTGNGDVST